MILVKRQITIQDTTQMDLGPVALRMREADKNEIWASHLLEPLPALELGFKFSKICRTAFQNARPVAIFGVVPNPEKVGTASIWMLGTDDLLRLKISFGDISRKMIDSFLELYPMLYNYVDVRNLRSIAWLKSCGAEFSEPAPYGVAKKPFMFFQLRKAL